MDRGNTMKKKSIVCLVVCLVVVAAVCFGANRIIIGRGLKAAETNIYNNQDYSLVYDYNYYKEKYPEVAQQCNNNKYRMLEYFVKNGMRKGQQASEDFDVYFYMDKYPDLKEAFGTDLASYYAHYINVGHNEKRIGSGVNGKYDINEYKLVFDYDYYKEKYPEIVEEYNDNENLVLEYFVDYGMSMGQQACESFDVEVYRDRYADLKNAFGDNLKEYYMHYITTGYAEGRKAD